MTDAAFTTPTDGAATGSVRQLLRLEGLAVLGGATAFYFLSGGNTWMFALAFFAPDLSFASYALGTKAGAIGYNAVHTYIMPILLAALGHVLGIEVLWYLALIVAAHIGFDRTFGYGLKYASGFGSTHLGRMGKGG